LSYYRVDKKRQYQLVLTFVSSAVIPHILDTGLANEDKEPLVFTSFSFCWWPGTAICPFMSALP